MRKKASIDPTAVNTKVGVLLTPEQIAASGTEHGHQSAFFHWIALFRKSLQEQGCAGNYKDLDLMFAVPNGGDRKGSVAAALKAEGVKRGVPDCCLPVPLWHYAGLYIEFKVPERYGLVRGGRSEEQVSWCKRLRANHYAVAVAYGWQAGVFVLMEYYAGRLVMPPDTDDALMVPSPVDG